MARHAFQVEQATRMGATHIIYPQDSYKTIQQATGAQLYQGLLGNKLLLGGYDVIFDTVGSKSTIHNSLRWARARGTVVLPSCVRAGLSPRKGDTRALRCGGQGVGGRAGRLSPLVLVQGQGGYSSRSVGH